MAGLVLALLLYASISVAVRRPYPTPLDFREATAPSYLLLLLAVAVLLLAALDPLPVIAPVSFARGYAAGAAFVAAPHLVGIARRECLHQFEIRDLHDLRTIVPRELLLCGFTFPAIALCEEVAFRGVLPSPWPAVALVQWLVYRTGARNGAGASAIACLFLAGLHQGSGGLGAVVGAHAAIQTLTGLLRSPGLFGGVFPLLEQVRWRNLSPGWQNRAVELAAGGALLGLAR
jgi:membrane protease YdiL (CAAX protease family)